MTVAEITALDYIQTVRSNVKKGVYHELGRLTLLIGPNGSGKTSVQNAIELGSGGFASDLEGRAKVKKSDGLSKLGPTTGKDPLFVELATAKGLTASWRLTPNKRGGYHEPEHVKFPGLNVVFPVQEVREILSGSPESVRVWLMSRVGADVLLEDVVSKLPETLQELYKERAGRIRRAETTEVDVLLELITVLDKEARAAMTEARVAKTTIDTMTEGLQEEPTVTEMAAAAADVTRATDAYNVAKKAAPPQRPDVEGLLLKANQAVGAFTELKAKLAAAQQALPQIDPGMSSIIAVRKQVANFCALSVHLQASRCMICESPIQIDLAAREKKLLSDNAEGLAVIEAKQNVDKMESELAQLQVKAKNYVQSYDAAEKLASSIAATAIPDLTELSDTLVLARTKLNRVQQQRQLWQNVRSTRDQVRRTEAIASQLNDLSESCSEVVSILLASAAKKFEAAVQQHLPEEDKFCLMLTDKKKDVCRLGFLREGALHTALSGAEWARLTLALGCATYKQTSSTLAIFIPEERAFDPDTLANVMKALENAPGQVILQSPNAPKPGSYPAWTIRTLSIAPDGVADTATGVTTA